MEELALSQIDPRLQKQIENASQAVEKGKPGYAIPVCNEVLRRHPGCVEVRRILRRAQMRSLSGSSSSGKKLFSKLTAAPLKLSSSNLVKKNPEKGMIQAEAQLAKNPENQVAHDLLGACSEQLQLWQTAALAYESIRALKPGNVGNLKKLTRAYIETGKMDEAIKIGDQILKQNPGDADAQNLIRQASVSHSLESGGWEKEGDYRSKLKDEGMARGLEQEGRAMSDQESKEQRIFSLLTQVEADPEQVSLYKALCENYRKSGALDKALVWIQKARQTRSGKNDVSLERQEHQLQEELLGAALQEAEEKRDRDPDSRAFREAYEHAEKALREYRLSRAQFLVERYPNDTEVRYQIGEILLEEGAVDEALGHLQIAQKNPKLRGVSLLLLGKGYALKKFYDLGAEQLRLAKEQTSEMNAFKKEVLYELALCYEAMGEKEKAASELKTLYSNDIGYRDVGERIKTFYSGA